MMRHSRSPFLAGYLAAMLGFAPLSAPMTALANPQNGNVAAGTATISGQGSSHVIVNQSSDRAVINWQTFNIGETERTQFIQPGASSIALNRVTGNLGPSTILGSIDANGRVFLVNPDGILFGSTAVINTAGFLATTHDITDADFMAGRNNFTIPGKASASIVNLGTITATNAGIAALVAPGVRNSGIITAELGKVALASNNGFTLDFYGDKLITMQVDGVVASQVKDVQTNKTLAEMAQDGATDLALVKNEGSLRANGGRVELTAAAARQVVDAVINNSGVIEANSVGTKNGMIVLGAATASTKGAVTDTQKVKVSGTLSASGKNAGEKGGKIQITGENIALAGAKLDASGKAGGGTVLVGGDVGGGKGNAAVASIAKAALESSTVPTATTVTVDAATLIDVSATERGNGGKAVIWSEQLTSFAGAIQARGGALGGDGGFAEVSSKVQLSYNGFGDLRAPAGKLGTLLIDPSTLYINDDGIAPEGSSGASAIRASTILEQLNLGLAEFVVTSSGNLSLQAVLTWTSASTLSLIAADDIAINAAITALNGGLMVRAGGAISADADINVGTFTLAGGAWRQTAWSTLPIFSAQDFRITGGSFLRALYGGETNDSPDYAIVDVYGLQGIGSSSELLSKSYVLANDIDAGGTSSWNGGAGFKSIGSLGNAFSGMLDGQGNIISGLTIRPNDTQTNAIGLFAAIGQGGSVHDLTMRDVTVMANAGYGLTQFIGALAGQNAGTISNVTVDNGERFISTIDGLDRSGIVAGGLVGQNGIYYDVESGIAGTIVSSYANVAVTVGSGSGCINDCAAAGWNVAGGLVGANIAGSTISYSSAEGTVVGGSFATLGGLVGQNGWSGQYPTAGTISNSWADVDVTSTGVAVMVGGLVGLNAPSSWITSSYALGDVTATGTVVANDGCGLTGNCTFVNAGGLVGQNQGLISGPTEGYGYNDNSYAWYDGYPYWTSTYASGNVHVGQNGTAGGLVGWNDGVITYASSSSRVTGDAGSGGINSNGSSTSLGGLVGSNSGVIIGSYATGVVGDSNVDNLQVGGLVADNSGAIYLSFAMNGWDNETSTGVLAGNNSVAGGLVANNEANTNDCVDCNRGYGFNNYAVILNSVAMTGVSVGESSVAGGLAGSGNGVFSNSSAIGTITAGANSVVGGLVGALGVAPSSSLINSEPLGSFWTIPYVAEFVDTLALPYGVSQSYAQVDVTSSGANSVVGGLVGVSGGTIVDSWSSGTVTGTSNSYLGGLVGINLGLVQSSSTDSSASVTGTSNNVAGGLIGLNLGTVDGTTDQLSESYGAVTSPDSIVGSLIGANAMFVNFAPDLIQGSQFPVGTNTSNSWGNGTVNGASATETNQLGVKNPTTGLPNYPNIVQGCNDPLCTALNTGVFGPIEQTNSPDTTTPDVPPPLQTIFTPGYLSFGGNSSSTPINLTQSSPPPSGDGSSDNNGKRTGNNPPPPPTGPPPGPGIGRTLSEQKFSGVPPLTETRFLPGEVVVQVSNTISPERIQEVARQLGISIVASQAIDGSGRVVYRFSTSGGKDIRDVIRALEKQQIVASAQPNYVFGLAEAVPARRAASTTIPLPRPAPMRMVQSAAPPPVMTPTPDMAPAVDAVPAHEPWPVTPVPAAAADATDATGALPPTPELSSDLQSDMASRTTGLPTGDAGQYIIDKLRLGAVHSRALGRNVTVAVIDSEIDTQHPDLAGVVFDRFDATGAAPSPHAHGTGMAGAIASHRRLLGIAPGVRILAVKAFDETNTSAEATSFQILKGLDWAIAKRPRIINMSFAGPRDLMLERAMQKAYDAGIVLIAAAGNAGPKSPPLYPAADVNVIAVSASDYADKPFAMANRGKHIAVAAPGVDVLVPSPKGGYQLTTGTSVAAAHVSGVAALLLEGRPGLTPKDVRRILTSTAKPVNVRGGAETFGAGIVDPFQALSTVTARSVDAAPARAVH